MVLPPPNVTGKLHLGHALTVTIEDTLCRHHRIKGGVAKWIPGFDHAGIATQVVVEQELWKKKGLRRDQLTREEFVEQCREWSEMNSTAIRKQLNILGATLDWKNAYYTLNEKFSSAVIEAFIRLHEDGLIYRDKRIVNWCPSLQSSISDQEVSRVDLSSPTKIVVPSSEGGKREVQVGTMYRIKYPLEGSDGFVSVATTRPETMFADVALAVHPEDSRYSHLVGKLVRHPLCSDRKLPVVVDKAVQMDKGTGVLKITPCHDALDWEIASRHREEILGQDPNALTRSCVDIRGRLNEEADEFAGLDRFVARTKVIEKLVSCGLFEGTVKHDGQISLCSRTGDVVEPRLTDQWFMNTEGLYEDAAQAVREGRIRILPAIHEQKLFDWLSNKDPWCLSRQLLWGHRIPAYRSEG
ncbi:tRNA ligase class I [Cooperia oncophora]